MQFITNHVVDEVDLQLYQFNLSLYIVCYVYDQRSTAQNINTDVLAQNKKNREELILLMRCFPSTTLVQKQSHYQFGDAGNADEAQLNDLVTSVEYG